MWRHCSNLEKVNGTFQCKPNIKTNCYTQNKEFCVPRLVNNYKGVIKTKIKRVYDVTYTNSMEFNYKKSKSTMNDDYGSKDAVCSRKPTQRCYNTPRKITRLTSTGTARRPTRWR